MYLFSLVGGRWYHWRIVRSCGDRLVSMLAGLHPVDGLLDFAVHIPNAGDANPNRFGDGGRRPRPTHALVRAISKTPHTCAAMLTWQGVPMANFMLCLFYTVSQIYSHAVGHQKRDAIRWGGSASVISPAFKY